MTFCPLDITHQNTIFPIFCSSYMLPTIPVLRACVCAPHPTHTHTHALNKHYVKRAWRHSLCFYDCSWQFNPILWEQPVATRDSCIMKSHTEETWQLCLPGILLLLMMYSDCPSPLSHFSFVFFFMSTPYCCLSYALLHDVPRLFDCHLLWSDPGWWNALPHLWMLNHFFNKRSRWALKAAQPISFH